MSIESARILLVNDENQVRLMLRQILKKAGFTNIVERADGVEASRHLAEHPVDILVTDIHMPHLDGWRLARMVRSGIFPSPASLPIVVVSATFSARIAAVTAKEYGINRFLTLEDKLLLPEVMRQLLQPPQPELTRPTLLVIEPDGNRREEILAGLADRYRVEVACHGDEGLAAWQERRHELVLLDAQLPEVSRMMQTMLTQRPLQPVVILACQQEMALCQRLMLEGAADLVPSPFAPHRLQEVCELALRREDYLISNLEFVERTRGANDRPPPLQDQEPPIRIHTLGAFRLEVEGETLTITRRSQPKPLELLKVLIALGGEDVNIDTIAEFLWPESEGDAAASAFHTTLHRLRKSLRLNDAVTLRHNRAILNRQLCWVDAFAFQELARELESALTGGERGISPRMREERVETLAARINTLYQGAFLERDGDPQWAILFRERLENRFLRLLAALGRFWEEREAWAKAVACHQRSQEVHGIGEEAQRRLMICLKELNQPAEAVASFQRHEKRLQRLGITPSPALRALCQELQHPS